MPAPRLRQEGGRCTKHLTCALVPWLVKSGHAGFLHTFGKTQMSGVSCSAKSRIAVKAVFARRRFSAQEPEQTVAVLGHQPGCWPLSQPSPVASAANVSLPLAGISGAGTQTRQAPEWREKANYPPKSVASHSSSPKRVAP